MQVVHLVYYTLAPHPPFYPLLALARPDLLVLACSGGLITVQITVQVSVTLDWTRRPAVTPALDTHLFYHQYRAASNLA